MYYYVCVCVWLSVYRCLSVSVSVYVSVMSTRLCLCLFVLFVRVSRCVFVCVFVCLFRLTGVCLYVWLLLQARGRVKTLQVYVTSVHWYKSYELMLTIEKLHNCLPTANSVEEGCQIYRSFPGAYREKTHGVLAFRISTVVNQTPTAPLTPPRTSCSQRVIFNSPCKRKRDDNGIVSRQSKLRNRLVFSSAQQENTQILSRVSHNVPPQMANPYNSLKHPMVWNMCYVNSVLQLLASSNTCINQCSNIKGPVANVLSSMRSRRCSASKMDCLLSHDVFQGDKKMFTLGNMNCAIEFMNWCVEEIKLHEKLAAVTRTLIEQTCTTCKRTCLAEVKGGPYGRGNASCIILVKGNITDHSDTDERIQTCWRGNDCPSVNSPSANVVRFREIRLHGEVVIYRWNAPCVQLQLQQYLCLTVNAQRNSKRIKYRLCGFTVFDFRKRHYTTYRYVSDTLYYCDDSSICRSNHTLTFSRVNERCVMAIYEMIHVNNEDVGAQLVSTCRSNCVTRLSPDKRGNIHAPITSLTSTSVKPSTITGDVLPHHWTAVHGDGFCWIYAFLVAVGMLNVSDFPHGNLASGPPSTRAQRLSRAIAPYAFPACTDVIFPEYENGQCARMGTFGGESNFMRLLERIRPSFRFFILDHTHTWVKRALIVKEPRINDARLVSHHGSDLTSLCGNCASSMYSVDYARGYGAPPLRMMYGVTTALPRNDEYVVYDDTDVVICWESAQHFNALSRSTPERTTELFLTTIISSPDQVSVLFPPPNDTSYTCNDSDSDLEII